MKSERHFSNYRHFLNSKIRENRSRNQRSRSHVSEI